MKRVFAEDVSSCINYGGRMELRAVVICPAAAVKVLDRLEKALVEIHLTWDWSRSENRSESTSDRSAFSAERKRTELS